MPFRQLFFVEGQLLGSALRAPVLVHTELVPPASGLWFCQHCGEVYAKAPVVDESTGHPTPWQSYRGLCRKCAALSPFASEIPGSIWLSWDRDFLAALPPDVLTWEFLRHLDRVESFHV